MFFSSQMHSQSLEKDSNKKYKLGKGTCNDLIIVEDEFEQTKQYKLPGNILKRNIEIYRKIGKNYDDKFIWFRVDDYTCSGNKKGLYIKLSNNEILRFDNNKIDCKYSNMNYSLSSYLEINKELYEKLSNYNIVQFKLGSKIVEVKQDFSNDFRIFFKCTFEDVSFEIPVKNDYYPTVSSNERNNVVKDTTINVKDADERFHSVKFTIYNNLNIENDIKSLYKKYEDVVQEANFRVMLTMKNKYTYLPKEISLIFDEKSGDSKIKIIYIAQNDFGAIKDGWNIVVYDNKRNFVKIF